MREWETQESAETLPSQPPRGPWLAPMLADFRVLQLDFLGGTADTRGMETNATPVLLPLVKTLRGYTDHAQFLYDCDRDSDGEIASVLGCYTMPNGIEHAVYSYRGEPVILVRQPGTIRHRVLRVPIGSFSQEVRS